MNTPDVKALKATALALMGVSIRKVAFELDYHTPAECRAAIKATMAALDEEMEARRVARIA